MVPRLDLHGFETLLPRRIDLADPKIDLSECGFVQPEGVLGLFLMLRYFNRLGRMATVKRPRNEDVDSYIERTGLYVLTYKYVEYKPNVEPIMGHTWYEHKTMQQITAITSQDDCAVIVDKFGVAVRQQCRDINIVKRVKSAMLETFQNIPDHANPADSHDFEGYSNLQSYKDGRRIIVAVGDIGCGIRESLLLSPRYNRLILNDLGALRKVVFEGASRFHGTPEQDRGGGILRAVTNVNNIGGFIAVRSGTASVWLMNDGRRWERTGLHYFPGTQICISTTQLFPEFFS